MPSQPGSHGSISSQTAGPTWAPPRAPLPPHRLAMLANALGVSTPLPVMTMSAAVSSPSPSQLGSSPSASSVDLTWRPITPSTAFVPPSQSKYLLHVIPPVHLPHESENSDSSELAPPPPYASGYHTQFRRGTLVALQSTLQAQLVVIAREYALPSTIGITLYLISSSLQSNPVPDSSPDRGIASASEPGPRLSEEIWKHIWTRVLRAEREESISLSQTVAPSPFGLGLTMEANGPSQPLRPLITPSRSEPTQPHPFAYPITPSTSTTSSVSDLQSHDKSGASSSRSEPNTPDTSQSSDTGPPGIELPGLGSNSIIPILAKVEFDIDRRKATWYEPWVRSRRMKRAESRSGRHTGSPSRSRDGVDADEKRLPYDLKLVGRMKKPSFLRSQDDLKDGEKFMNGEYAPLDGEEDPTSRMISGPDPLGDVFGTDAETWNEIHSESEDKRRKNRDDDGTDEVDEVRDIMHRMSRPALNVLIPETDGKRRSSPTTAGGSKRPTPAPLVLTPKPPSNTLIADVDGAHFRDKEGLSLEMEQEYLRSRSPGEEKRVGTLFEHLDLGLELGDDDEEYDENDPNDRRRSQYLMKAKLDELEKTLAQFSPQQLKTVMLDEDVTMAHRRNTSLPPPDFASGPPGDTVWSAVPYTSLGNSIVASSSRRSNFPPSPPRLAVNGVTTGTPKAFVSPTQQLQTTSSTMPAESQVRRRELEQATYPSDFPIPLSPDPFGRYPSVYDTDTPPVQSYWDPGAQKISYEHLDPRPSLSFIDEGLLSTTNPSSRFSADSSSIVVDTCDKTVKHTAPLVSVKGLKKLWRRSKPTAGAVSQPPTPATASFRTSGSPPPPTPTDPLPTPAFPIGRNINGKSPVGQLQFDQESPYPSHPRPSLSASRPTSPAVLINPPSQEKPGGRKSILKSWKSASGAGSQQQINGSESWKYAERPVSNETIKPRRPSVSIPPSPQLPEQYLPSNHARTGSTFFERRKHTGVSKPGHGQHQSSPSREAPQTPLTMQTSSPSQSEFSATSRDSHAESSDQFELVSSPKIPPNLTYPYTIDHE